MYSDVELLGENQNRLTLDLYPSTKLHALVASAILIIDKPTHLPSNMQHNIVGVIVCQEEKNSK